MYTVNVWQDLRGAFALLASACTISQPNTVVAKSPALSDSVPQSCQTCRPTDDAGLFAFWRYYDLGKD